MIVVLLLAAGLVLGGIGFGVYLLVRPDPPADESGRTTTTSSTTTSPDETVTSAPAGTAPDVGSGSTAVENPGDPGGGLRDVARDYVGAVNARDEAAATGLTCQGTDPGTLFSVTEGREVSLAEVEVIEGSVASATVRVGGEETALLLENQEDGWCVSI